MASIDERRLPTPYAPSTANTRANDDGAEQHAAQAERRRAAPGVEVPATGRPTSLGPRLRHWTDRRLRCSSSSAVGPRHLLGGECSATLTIAGTVSPLCACLPAFLHPVRQAHPRRSSSASCAARAPWCGTTDGHELVDGMASLWYCDVGHGRAEIADAVAAQLRTLAAYSCFDPFTNEPADALAAELVEIGPMPDARVFFCSSGSEAVDSAMKLARIAHVLAGQPQRKLIISRAPAATTASPTAAPAPRASPPTRRTSGRSSTTSCRCPADDVEALATLDGRARRRGRGRHHRAGAGRRRRLPAADGYLQALRKLCDQHGAYLVFDEVITGFGRLGTWFAAHHYGVTPDLVTFAKAVTSGYLPLGGVFVGAAPRAALEADPAFFLRHGFTYSGHAAACAAGLAQPRDHRATRRSSSGPMHVGDRLGERPAGARRRRRRSTTPAATGRCGRPACAADQDAVAMRDRMLDRRRDLPGDQHRHADVLPAAGDHRRADRPHRRHPQHRCLMVGLRPTRPAGSLALAPPGATRHEPPTDPSVGAAPDFSALPRARVGVARLELQAGDANSS